MLHKAFKSAGRMLPPLSAKGLPPAALLLVGVAFLAGCQTLSRLGIEPRTAASLHESSSAKEPGDVSARPGEGAAAVVLDRAAVKRLQKQLDRLGFRPGPADGILGRQTEAAIRRYQEAYRLPVTGATSPRFLAHLEAMSARASRVARVAVNLTAEDLPAYRPGTTFVYSNGDIERVSRVDGSTVQWVRDDGMVYTAPRNFMLPWSYWSSDQERGKSTIIEAPDTLWPVREGAAVTFSAKIAVQRKDDIDATERRVERWRCRNDGQRDTTVPAGSFETVVLVCRRATNPASPELVRTWYYAKSVRHYVRFIESDPASNTTRSIDLVAVRPGAPGWPPIVRAALARAIAHTLETEESEARMPWASSAVDTRVTIEASRRFVDDDGMLCRRFVQIWSDRQRRRHYPALACRTGLETWEIPGLEATTEVSLEPAAKIL